MPRLAVPLLLVLVACTGSSARPLRPLDTSGAAIPWQVRCAQAVWSAASEAADPRLAGAEVGFHTWHGDNYTYYVVELRSVPPEALSLRVTRQDPPVSDGSVDGWQEKVEASRVVWRRDGDIDLAELEFPAAARRDVESTRVRLAAAVDGCFADPPSRSGDGGGPPA